MKPPTDLVISLSELETAYAFVAVNPNATNTTHFLKDVAEAISDRVLRRDVSPQTTLEGSRGAVLENSRLIRI
jgi:hypothetical protein